MPALALLGRPMLAADGDVILTGRPVQRHCLALLALLAGERRGLSRERILGYLWAEQREGAARHRLSVALHVLRRELGGGSIVAAGDALLLAPGEWRIDAREFEDASARGEFTRALALYQGPLLEGFYLRGAPAFEEWLERWRLRLARRYWGVLDAAAGEAEERGDLASAVVRREQLAEADPCSSSGTVALMRVLAASGRPERAIGRARAYALLLREEYGLSPDPSVVAYAEQLARG